MPGSTNLRRLRGVIVAIAIMAATLATTDLVMSAVGVFPPTATYGDSLLGWRSAGRSSGMQVGVCQEYESGSTFRYARNEDGIRTAWTKQALLSDTTHLLVGVGGDSQSDLCAPNDSVHSGILEAELDARGIPAVALLYASGRYSPLQSYLAMQDVVIPYNPDVLVLNVYTGNDLYDLLRDDDRPHFEKSNGRYVVAPPTWYTYDDPKHPPRSRLAYLARRMADAAGIRMALLRLAYLRTMATAYDEGLGTTAAYLRAILQARAPSLGYPDAFTAQMLNQQLFFHYFRGSEQEALRRMRELLQLIKRENPSRLLVLSPLPSYELVLGAASNPALRETLSRLPVSLEEGIEQESRIYYDLKRLAAEEGWLFVDNLPPLRGSEHPESLYNHFDYHLTPDASILIGRAQATVIAGALRQYPARGR